jgi:hypothetical protein
MNAVTSLVTGSPLAQLTAKVSDSTTKDPSSKQTYESLVAAHHLEKRNEFLSSVFSKNPAGNAYTQILTLLKYGPSRPLPTAPAGSTERQPLPETAWIGDQLAALRSMPSDALSELRQSLPHLGPGFSTERQYRVKFIGSLDANPQDKMAVLAEELQRGMSLTPTSKDDPALFNGSTTLQVMVNLAAQPSDIEPILVQAMGNQPDSTLKLMLLSIYANKFPQQALKLRSSLGL